jgi:hypothetical protein
MIVVASGLAFPSPAHGQAWTPAKGEGAVSMAFQDLFYKYHIATTTRVDAGRIETMVLLSDVTYGLTDKIAVDLAVPFVSSKYDGPKPHPNTTIDDGTFHSSFTDFRMSVRYNLTRKGAVITPYFGSVVPSHDYPFYGHSAAGERLNEVQAGAFVAKLFTKGLPGSFVSGASRMAGSRKCRISRTTGPWPTSKAVTSSRRRFARSAWSARRSRTVASTSRSEGFLPSRRSTS